MRKITKWIIEGNRYINMTGGNVRNTFGGWVYPEQFVGHYQHVHKDRHSSFLGHLVGLRQPAHVVTKPSKEKEIYRERIVYVGCIHGGNDDIFDRLTRLEKNPPDCLIFAGDITGSAEIERLKKHFYDEKEKDPNSPYARFAYFGEWAATLPKAKREVLFSDLRQNAQRLLKVIKRIKKHGTKIYIIEGNWDNWQLGGIRSIAGKDIRHIFDTEDFFIRNGYSFINHLETLQTKTTWHILLPYITLLHFDLISQKKILEVQHGASEAKDLGKTVVMVGHAEANWRVHHLYQKNTPIEGNRRVVIQNFGRAMALFQPDEVIYPHQHARIRDEKGNLIDVNAKYLLQVHQSGVRLIDHPDTLGIDSKQIVVTYVPFGFLAEEDFIGV